MFGTKSERLRVLENAQQLALGEMLALHTLVAQATRHVVIAYGSPCIFRSRNMTTATAAASKTMAAPAKNVIPTALV